MPEETAKKSWGRKCSTIQPGLLTFDRILLETFLVLIRFISGWKALIRPDQLLNAIGDDAAHQAPSKGNVFFIEIERCRGTAKLTAANTIFDRHQ